MVEASPQRANMGFIGAIVAVATIGGFLFGYDSGAVNGTQDGLTKAFNLVPGSLSPSNGLGFTVGSLLIGCFIGAFFAGRLADVMGRRNVMRIAALLFLIGALVQGIRPRPSVVRPGADHGRHGGRRGKHPVTGLHIRSRTGEHSRPDDDGSADHDHHRPDRRVRRQLFPGPRRGRVDQRVLGRARSVALDVSDAGAAGGDLPRRLVLHPGKPALPGLEGPDDAGQ